MSDSEAAALAARPQVFSYDAQEASVGCCGLLHILKELMEYL